MLPRTELRGVEAYLERYHERHLHLPRSVDIAREAIREAILDGCLLPGTVLREERLATVLRMSRTPIREALRQLHGDGLIILGSYQSATVNTTTLDEILAMFPVLEVLEGRMARLAAQRSIPAHEHKLLAILNDMEAIAQPPDIAKLARLDLQFHAELRRIAANPYLDRLLEQFEYAVKISGETTYSYAGRGQASIDEHRAIVRAIFAGDAESADALAMKHKRSERQVWLQVLMDDL